MKRNQMNEIEWLHGKCLTQKILKKKPKKGTKNAKPITKTGKLTFERRSAIANKSRLGMRFERSLIAKGK
ncbi:hypothetical protein E3N88_10181 [Mikania micrantha]|uniref:Uncharacterized protein n=1 Tax=Mikania micrantha TaxID=192012 RepID=A0A5N6P9Y2_9ASTR|nr:hypothetical protein E3N88_10181 [Mikania micrantha]